MWLYQSVVCAADSTCQTYSIDAAAVTPTVINAMTNVTHSSMNPVMTYNTNMIGPVMAITPNIPYTPHSESGRHTVKI